MPHGLLTPYGQKSSLPASADCEPIRPLVWMTLKPANASRTHSEVIGGDTGRMARCQIRGAPTFPILVAIVAVARVAERRRGSCTSEHPETKTSEACDACREAADETRC